MHENKNNYYLTEFLRIEKGCYKRYQSINISLTSITSIASINKYLFHRPITQWLQRQISFIYLRNNCNGNHIFDDFITNV